MKAAIRVFLGREALEHCEKYANKAECRKIFQILLEQARLEPRKRYFPFLSGLPRTGKTAMLYAAMAAIEDAESIAYITFEGPATTRELGQCLLIFESADYYSSVDDFVKNQWEWEPASPEVERILELCLGGPEKRVIKHVFVDNLENVADFTTNSKWISDFFRYAAPQIVFAGLPMTVDLCLSDCFLGEGCGLNMNFISFREWSCLAESRNVWTYLKEAGVFGLKSGVKYLEDMLDEIDLAVRRNRTRYDDINPGIWYGLNRLFRNHQFRQDGMDLLSLNTLRLLHDAIARHFSGNEAIRALQEEILRRMLALEKNLQKFHVDTGEAETFFKMLSAFGVLQPHRIIDMQGYDPDKESASMEEILLAIIVALEKEMDPAEKEKAFEIIKAPRWLPTQPALALNLMLSTLKNALMELGHNPDEEICKTVAREARAQALLGAVLTNAHASCPKRGVCEDGWELESVLSPWGHIDLIATCRDGGSRHSEVFVLAETARHDPEKMLNNPELRAMLQERFSDTCEYYILYFGESRYEPDGASWLNIVEFLESLSERWVIRK